jgi:hypothetical protein
MESAVHRGDNGGVRCCAGEPQPGAVRRRSPHFRDGVNLEYGLWSPTMAMPKLSGPVQRMRHGPSQTLVHRPPVGRHVPSVVLNAIVFRNLHGPHDRRRPPGRRGSGHQRLIGPKRSRASDFMRKCGTQRSGTRGNPIPKNVFGPGQEPGPITVNVTQVQVKWRSL